MKIQLLNLLHNNGINQVNGTKFSTPLKNNSVSLPSLQNDVFVKSENVAFKGTNDELSVKDVLIGAGIVGAPLLFEVALMTKVSQPEELFTHDGYYIGNVNDFKTETDKILIDKSTGEINFKGTGLHIDPSKYDYVDADNGIYQNYDGSADIDLSQNKFIDKNLGIIVDPENNITAFKNDEGLYEFKDMVNFGSGYPTNSNVESMPSAKWTRLDEQTRSEFTQKHDATPEDYFHNDPDLRSGISGHYLIKPDDYRNTLQKIEDFFTGKNIAVYDCWGRRLFRNQNENGTTTTYAMSDEAIKYAQEHNLSDDKVAELINFADQVRLQQYVEENHPELKQLIDVTHDLELSNYDSKINYESIFGDKTTDNRYENESIVENDYEDNYLTNFFKIALGFDE